MRWSRRNVCLLGCKVRRCTSVSLAQHVHRNLALWSGQDDQDSLGENPPEGETRKDRPLTLKNPSWRIYLDNYDLLERVDALGLASKEGTLAPAVLALRHEYERWKIPRKMSRRAWVASFVLKSKHLKWMVMKGSPIQRVSW